jgi:hypothetical protein
MRQLKEDQLHVNASIEVVVDKIFETTVNIRKSIEQLFGIEIDEDLVVK